MAKYVTAPINDISVRPLQCGVLAAARQKLSIRLTQVVQSAKVACRLLLLAMATFNVNAICDMVNAMQGEGWLLGRSDTLYELVRACALCVLYAY